MVKKCVLLSIIYPREVSSVFWRGVNSVATGQGMDTKGSLVFKAAVKLVRLVSRSREGATFWLLSL